MSSPGKDILQVYGVLNFVYLLFIFYFFVNWAERDLDVDAFYCFFLMKSIFCLFFSSPFSNLVFFSFIADRPFTHLTKE